MKSFSSHIFLLLVLTGCSLFSKADTTDNYQLYIRNKLVLTEAGFGSALKKVNLLVFKRKNYKDSIYISFNHCMSGSTKRRIQLIDSTQKVLFEWNFPDEVDRRLMVLPIHQILEKSSLPFLSLYYYDSQVPKGSFIALVAFEDRNLTRVISTYKQKFKNY